MANSRQPRVIGRVAVAESDLIPGIERTLHTFETAYVIGYYGEPRSRPRRERKSAGGTRVITVVGDFPNPWKDDAEEIAGLEDDRWFPSTDDFIAVEKNSKGHTNKDVPVIGSVEAFLYHILNQPKGSIKRINILTHGSADNIAFSGEIDKDGAVYFKEEMDIGTLRGLLLHGIIYRKRHVDWQEVEDRFADDAEIVVYACKAALGERVLQDMANIFGVTIKGFKKELHYRHETLGSKTVLHRNRITVDGQTDFQKLTPPVVKTYELKDPF